MYSSHISYVWSVVWCVQSVSRVQCRLFGCFCALFFIQNETLLLLMQYNESKTETAKRNRRKSSTPTKRQRDGKVESNGQTRKRERKERRILVLRQMRSHAAYLFAVCIQQFIWLCKVKWSKNEAKRSKAELWNCTPYSNTATATATQYRIWLQLLVMSSLLHFILLVGHHIFWYWVLNIECVECVAVRRAYGIQWFVCNSVQCVWFFSLFSYTHQRHIYARAINNSLAIWAEQTEQPTEPTNERMKRTRQGKARQNRRTNAKWYCLQWWWTEYCEYLYSGVRVYVYSCICNAQSQSHSQSHSQVEVKKQWQKSFEMNWVRLKCKWIEMRIWKRKWKGINHYLNTWANMKRRACIIFKWYCWNTHRQTGKGKSKSKGTLHVLKEQAVPRRSIEYYMVFTIPTYKRSFYSVHDQKPILVYAYTTSFLYVWYVMRLS